ncbi:hypothetical protein RFI_08214 [Reticulomyxa filosa]|uniref:HECT-type E3 ubiquitin transferase n=1 Tax=Reticulomyxa filosa TaxID=46433 RepID=X6NUI7_RETFI|nr:hypothetical protein RFI_08214 [Reticulomyxa filosa]|eukprot:ETO28912.1 hypothetical protein RFI_08214 [Reticulomyxa filosa]
MKSNHSVIRSVMTRCDNLSIFHESLLQDCATSLPLLPLIADYFLNDYVLLQLYVDVVLSRIQSAKRNEDKDLFDPNTCYEYSITEKAPRLRVKVGGTRAFGFNMLSAAVKECDKLLLTRLLANGGKIALPPNHLNNEHPLHLAFSSYLDTVQAKHKAGVGKKNQPPKDKQQQAEELQQLAVKEANYRDILKHVLQALPESIADIFSFLCAENKRHSRHKQPLDELLLEIYGFETLYNSVLAEHIVADDHNDEFAEMMLLIFRHIKKLGGSKVKQHAKGKKGGEDGSTLQEHDEKTVKKVSQWKEFDHVMTNFLMGEKFDRLCYMLMVDGNLNLCQSFGSLLLHKSITDLVMEKSESLEQMSSNLKMISTVLSCVNKHLYSSCRMILFRTSQFADQYFRALYSKLFQLVFVIHRAVLLPHWQYLTMDRSNYLGVELPALSSPLPLEEKEEKEKEEVFATSSETTTEHRHRFIEAIHHLKCLLNEWSHSWNTSIYEMLLRPALDSIISDNIDEEDTFRFTIIIHSYYCFSQVLSNMRNDVRLMINASATTPASTTTTATSLQDKDGLAVSLPSTATSIDDEKKDASIDTHSMEMVKDTTKTIKTKTKRSPKKSAFQFVPFKSHQNMSIHDYNRLYQWIISEQPMNLDFQTFLTTYQEQFAIFINTNHHNDSLISQYFTFLLDLATPTPLTIRLSLVNHVCHNEVEKLYKEQKRKLRQAKEHETEPTEHKTTDSMFSAQSSEPVSELSENQSEEKKENSSETQEDQGTDSAQLVVNRKNEIKIQFSDNQKEDADEEQEQGADANEDEENEEKRIKNGEKEEEEEEEAVSIESGEYDNDENGRVIVLNRMIIHQATSDTNPSSPSNHDKDAQNKGTDQNQQAQNTTTREVILESIAQQVNSIPPVHLHEEMEVQYENEPGIGDGPLREFMTTVAKMLFFDQTFRLFTLSPDGKSIHITPFPLLQLSKDLIHLFKYLFFFFDSYYKFAGKLLGLCLIYEVPIGVKLSNGILKYLLGEGKELNWTDMKYFDESMYTTFKGWIDNTSQHDKTSTYGLNFSLYDNVTGKEVLLCENGDKLDVCETNKLEYANLYTQTRLTLNIESQLKSLGKGFWSLFPLNVIKKCLSIDHLRLAFAGPDMINVEEWQKHMTYHGFNKNDRIIQWFWSYVKSLNEESLRNLLLFWSGSSIPPLYGFTQNAWHSRRHEPWSVNVLYGQDLQSLPKASTCSYSLSIPHYPTFEILKNKFDTALKFGYYGYHEQ